MSFRREKFVPLGGPDGGDGGRGGAVIIVRDDNAHTLANFKGRKKLAAQNGADGAKKNQNGKSGANLEVRVPQGTQVIDAESGEILCDMSGENERKVLLQGGKGGLGNAHFKSAQNQRPDYAQPGIKGQSLRVRLELKLIADVGLVGFPNVGKSTLISVLSNAKPEIADYEFTTLTPKLGLVEVSEYKSFVMADIPGIIEGASEGKGLGLRFLRHIERNSLLLFMVPGDTDDIKKEYEVLLGELKNFNPEMLDKHRVLAVTKCDLLDDELIEMLKETLPDDLPVVFISSVTGQGIQDLKDVLWKELNSESNKLQEITAEDTLVHRDKDMSRFQAELEAEGEDEIEYIDDDELEDVEDLEDFEYE